MYVCDFVFKLLETRSVTYTYTKGVVNRTKL